MAKNIEFVDFVPQIADRIPLEGRVKYQKFPCLVERVNKWLSTRPGSSVLSVETIQISGNRPVPQASFAAGKLKAGKLNLLTTESVVRDTPISYLTGLRLWMRPKTIRDGTNPEILKYITAVPNIKLTYGTSEYDTEYYTCDNDALFQSANEFISRGRITGRFVSAELTPVYLTADRINFDVTGWAVDGPSQKYFTILRIYYAAGDFILLLPNVRQVDFYSDPDGPGTTDVGTDTGSERCFSQLMQWWQSNPKEQVLGIRTVFGHSSVGEETARKGRCRWNRRSSPQKAVGLRVICCGDSQSSCASSSCYRSELFVPKLSHVFSWLPFRKHLQVESQASLLERISDWVRFETYRNESLEAVVSETVDVSLPCEINQPWFFLVIRWLGKWKRKSDEPILVKACRIYFRYESKATE